MPTPFSFSNIIATGFTGSITVDALIYGFRWENNAISYSFPGVQSVWSTNPFTGYDPGDEPWSLSYAPLSLSNRSDFETALQQWQNVADLEFELINETQNTVGDIRIAYSQVPALSSAEAWAYLPAQGVWGGDIWVNKSSVSANREWAPGNYSFLTILHEIGHALGLTHPFDDPAFPTADNTMSSTIMSYAALPGNQDSIFDYYPTTPMPLDIMAIQHMYGANTDFQKDNSTILFTDDETYHETIFDTGGIDTITYTGSQHTIIQLTAGSGSYIGNAVHAISETEQIAVPNIWIAFDTVIENAAGGINDDEIYGNPFDNILSGNAGNDILAGLEGNDTFLGGTGIDEVVFTGELTDYLLNKTTDGFSITHQTGTDGNDILLEIERVRFNDKGLALDIDGHAGRIAKLVSVTFGADAVSNRDLIRTGLSLIDNGASNEELAFTALTALGISSHNQLVSLLWHNLYGFDPTPDEKQPYVTLLDSQQLSAADLTILAASTPLNDENIDLVGLMQSGLVYSL
ncbi:Peptidase M10 serralysin C terminal [Nitrosomonas marina]|uniref:Peptidase M10 serralysin C terminal n=1 Tax=Nitrosomonas marina TaxID=917 RepID=A0A1I0CPD2_9PROT|nr:M10 family metallopeptidase [Nitrosomonas marina]SET21129.1 Peptidase M10 serralysin C terminal [Nitrosomonas marina]